MSLLQGDGHLLLPLQLPTLRLAALLLLLVITTHCTPARPGGPAGPIGPGGPVVRDTHDSKSAQRQQSVSVSAYCCQRCYSTWFHIVLLVRSLVCLGCTGIKLTSLSGRPRLASRTYCVLAALGNASWLQRHCTKQKTPEVLRCSRQARTALTTPRSSRCRHATALLP